MNIFSRVLKALCPPSRLYILYNIPVATCLLEDSANLALACTHTHTAAQPQAVGAHNGLRPSKGAVHPQIA